MQDLTNGISHKIAQYASACREYDALVATLSALEGQEFADMVRGWDQSPIIRPTNISKSQSYQQSSTITPAVEFMATSSTPIPTMQDLKNNYTNNNSSKNNFPSSSSSSSSPLFSQELDPSISYLKSSSIASSISQDPFSKLNEFSNENINISSHSFNPSEVNSTKMPTTTSSSYSSSFFSSSLSNHDTETWKGSFGGMVGLAPSSSSLSTLTSTSTTSTSTSTTSTSIFPSTSTMTMTTTTMTSIPMEETNNEKITATDAEAAESLASIAGFGLHSQNFPITTTATTKTTITEEGER